MRDQARTLFDELVERGEKIESEAKEKLEETNKIKRKKVIAFYPLFPGF